MNPPTCVPPAVHGSPWSNAAVMATFLGCLVFVIAYAWSTRGRWRTTIMGKHIMIFMVVILTVTSLAVMSIIFGTVWPHRDLIRTLAWGSIATVIWWRVLLLFRAQSAAIPEPTEEADL
jgi:hypothetical protein